MPTSDDVPRNPGLEDLLQVFGQGLLDDLRTGLPAICTDYNASTGRGSFQTTVRHGRINEVGDRVTDVVSECHDVPILFFGGGANRITFPVHVGDQAVLKFCSSAISQWKALARIADPLDDRHHDLSDAIAFMGATAGTPPTDAPTDAIVTHGKTKIGGSTGTQRTFMADSLLTALDVLIASISTAVGTITGGTAAAADILTAKGVFDTAAAAAKTVLAEVK